MKQRALTESADVTYAVVGLETRLHYSPGKNETLCGRPVSKHRDLDQAWELLDQHGYKLCTLCVRAAIERAKATPCAHPGLSRGEQAPVLTRGPAVHEFNSTRRAYDLSQTSDDIADGDVLVVASEYVVAFLRGAWPVAISEQHGELHTLTAPAREIDGGTYAITMDMAERIAHNLTFPLAAIHQQPSAAGPSEIARTCTSTDEPERA